MAVRYKKVVKFSSSEIMTEPSSLEKKDLEASGPAEESNDIHLFERLKYRPEVDGFRAFAVIPVLLYHFGFSFPGGFAGVDVFFVISGLLIITMVLNKLEDEKFSQKDFWMRRVRRLFPVLAVVASFTFLAGGLILPGDYLIRLQEDLRYTLAFGANIFFFVQSTQVKRVPGGLSNDTESMGGYFDVGEKTDDYRGPVYISPFLHCWSLATEEQFYLIMPMLLTFVLWLAPKKERKVTFVFAAITTLFLFSLGLSTGFGYDQNKTTSNFSYYMLPTRMWEMLLGGYFAFKRNWGCPNNPWLRDLLATIGVAMVAASYFVFDATVPWPGIAALVPCMGSMLFFESQRTGLSTIWGTVFTSAPVVFIGKISYSLYLVHWPIYALTFAWYENLNCEQSIDGDKMTGIPNWVKAVGLLLSFVLSVLFYFSFEDRLRSKKKVPNRVFFPTALVTWITLFVLTFPIIKSGFPTCEYVPLVDMASDQTLCGNNVVDNQKIYQERLAEGPKFNAIFRKSSFDAFPMNLPHSAKVIDVDELIAKQAPNQNPEGKALVLNDEGGQIDLLVTGDSTSCQPFLRLNQLNKAFYNKGFAAMTRVGDQMLQTASGLPYQMENDFAEVRKLKPKKILLIVRNHLFEITPDKYKMSWYKAMLKGFLEISEEVILLENLPEASMYVQNQMDDFDSLVDGAKKLTEVDPTPQIDKEILDYVDTLGPEMSNKLTFLKTRKYFFAEQDSDELMVFNPRTERLVFSNDNNHHSNDGIMLIDDVLRRVLESSYKSCKPPKIVDL